MALQFFEQNWLEIFSRRWGLCLFLFCGLGRGVKATVFPLRDPKKGVTVLPVTGLLGRPRYTYPLLQTFLK